MKKHIRKPDGYEMNLDRLERLVAEIDPACIVRIDDVCRAAGVTDMSDAITKAAAMLLQKYGIAFRR